MIRFPSRSEKLCDYPCVEMTSESDYVRARYHYRGYEFVVEKRGRKWWCFQGIRRPSEEWESADISPWSLISIVREDGWASRKRERIIQKLRRSVDSDLATRESLRTTSSAEDTAEDTGKTECPECSSPERLYSLWKERTGHTEVLTAEDRSLCEPFVATYGFELVDRAIAGIAYDHYVTGERVWDDWEFLFRGHDRFEDYVNRAPRNWKPSPCKNCRTHITKERS